MNTDKQTTVDEARAALLGALAGNRDAPVLDRLNDFEEAVDSAARAEAYRQGYESAVYDAEAKLAAVEALPRATCYRTHTQLDEGRGVFGAVWIADVARALRSTPALAATPAEEERT